MKKMIRCCMVLLLAVSICLSCNSKTTGISATGEPDDLVGLIAGKGMDERTCRLGNELTSDNMIVDAIHPGRYISDKGEFLVVLRPVVGMMISRAMRFYHRYVVVLNPSMDKVVSSPKCFEADEGIYAVFRSKEKSYVLFLGSVIYQGDVERMGGIYDADGWKRIWPADNGFWEKHMVDFRDGILRVSKREANGYKFDCSMVWDEKAGRLINAYLKE